MVSVGDIRQWDLGALDQLITTLKTRNDTLTELDFQLGSIGKLDGWEGTAGDEARKSFVNARDDVTDKAAAVGAVRQLAVETEASVTALKNALTEAEYLASANEFEIRDDNAVVDRWVDTSGRSEQEIYDHNRMKVELVDRVEQLVRTGTDIETDAAGVLRKAAEGGIDDRGASTVEEASRAGEEQGGLSRLDPPEDGSPADNSGWWRSLSDEQRAEIVEQNPDLVGNLDGIPASVRNEANLARLDAEQARLEQTASDLQAELDENTFGGGLSNADAGLEQTNEKLAAIEAIRKEMENPDGTPKDDRQLLLFDVSGEYPKAAVASGDVDTADHVAVFIPGTNAMVKDNWIGEKDEGNDLPTYMQQMEGLRTETTRQLNNSGLGDQTVATIAYVGYEPPVNFGQAGSGHYADDNAPQLQSFLNGIDSSRTDDPHLTTLGHSYGSLVTSEALQRGTGVDAAVFMGSPGLDTSGDDIFGVEQMNLPSGDAYLLKADGDTWVTGVATTGSWHGPNPDGMDGLTRLSTNEGTTPSIGTGPGEDKQGSTGHSEYTSNDTMSQYNQAVVIAGLPEELLVR